MNKPLFSFFLFHCCLLISVVQAQKNLVPNAGFEKVLSTKSGHSFMNNVTDWDNANANPTTGYYGTPDLLYNVEKGRAYRYTFRPHQGNAAAGVISYMQRVPNYREYITVRLNEMLEKGEEYYCELYITSGYKKAFGCIGTSGLGVAFSTAPLLQKIYEPILIKPIFHLKTPFYSTEWQKVSFTFKAEASFYFLTIGNFNTDNNTAKKYFSYDIDPQSYFYIDDVSLVLEKERKKEKVIIPTVAKKEISPQKKLQGRVIQTQRNLAIEGKSITLKVWDRKEVDGDVISLKFNGEWILRKYSLQKKKKKIKIVYEPNKPNELILFADHLGTIPPNTAAFEIISKNKRYLINLKSDFGYCGAIQFFQ